MNHRRPRLRAAVLLEAMMGAALLAIGLTALLVPMGTLTHTRTHQRALMGAIGIANEQADKHRPPLPNPAGPVTIVQPPGMPAYTVSVNHSAVPPLPAAPTLTRVTVVVRWTEGVMPHNYTMVTHVAR
jgi:hypothetical protein